MRHLAAALAAILVVLLPGTPAWAHNQLVTAVPAQNTTLTETPRTVTLTFRQVLNPDFTTIVVSDTARTKQPSSVPAVDGTRGTVT
jgi:methionine-rich copper-binding protein CopC